MDGKDEILSSSLNVNAILTFEQFIFAQRTLERWKQIDSIKNEKENTLRFSEVPFIFTYIFTCKSTKQKMDIANFVCKVTL